MPKNARSVLDSYNTLYKAMDFERLGLFRLVAETFRCREVLYPGCSVHVTPSFVFPHVVYVDKSAEAKRFFAAHEEVLDFVTRNREYKRKPFIQFLHRDYSESLPLRAESFDLLLSLFAGNTAHFCANYLRMGGLLLTNQREDVDSNFKLMAVIRFEGGKYQFVSEADIPVKEAVKRYLRQSHRGLEYAEIASYFILEKHDG